MHSPEKTAVRHAPRWSLWLVALLCFGPVTAVWLLGVLILPFWAAMIALPLTEPERFSHDPTGALIWDAVWPIAYVAAGFVGLAGLLRVLTLSRRERPTSHRFLTIGMVTVGLTALLIFDAAMFIGLATDLSAGLPVAGFAVYFALPFTGAAWLLWESWEFLFAARRRRARSTRGAF